MEKNAERCFKMLGFSYREGNKAYAGAGSRKPSRAPRGWEERLSGCLPCDPRVHMTFSGWGHRLPTASSSLCPGSTCVDDDVLGQIPHVDKGLAAHAALVWADVVMVADVVGQLARLDKPAGRGQ